MKTVLNGSWKVRIDPDEHGLVEKWAEAPIQSEMTVQVPGCIQQLDCLAEQYPSGCDLRNAYLGTFFMEKEFELPDYDPKLHYYAYIGGASPTCHIWVNGEYAARNIFCITEIRQEITKYVKSGTNRITVAITEQYHSLATGLRFEDLPWSGLYGQVWIESSGAIFFKDAYVSLHDGKAEVVALVENNGGAAFCGSIAAKLGDKAYAFDGVEIPPQDSAELRREIDVSGLPRWSYRSPELVEFSLSCIDPVGVECVYQTKTGLREIKTAGTRILVDGMPTLFAGAGEEYYSPTIAPLTDEKIIRARYAAMLSYGFNYFRYHTHFPTEEELCIADEMGMMISMEFGIVSNFAKMEPLELALDMMDKYVCQSRRHPSLMIYGLGNEGSQLMAKSAVECAHAKIGYEHIKARTTNQFAIIAYGIQGEIPELKNDIETPHLWSENFIWAYDGLTDVPWDALKETVGDKPNILHEYGKFCSWPTLEDEKQGTLENGAKPFYGTQSHEWMVNNHLGDLEERIIRNSRLAVNEMDRIVLEDGRRQDYVNGYVLWTFFRDSWRGRGLCDDVGKNTNGEEPMFRFGPNADVAILMDRGFQNRAVACGIGQNIRLSVSNFGTRALSGQLRAVLTCNGQVLTEAAEDVSAAVGDTKEVMQISFTVPVSFAGKKLLLKAEWKNGDATLAVNTWKFWAYDSSSADDATVYLHIKDPLLHRSVKKVFPNGHRLSSVDSVKIGCRSWDDPQLVKTAQRRMDVIIIADVYDEIIAQCIKNGNKVLLLDSGRIPDDWFCPPQRQDLGDRDTTRFYSTFRTGWDTGTLSTLVEDSALFGDFEHDGYCDLQFFDLIQLSRPLDLEVLKEKFGYAPRRIVSTLAKVKGPKNPENEVVVQDVNAIKALKMKFHKRFHACEQGYLTQVGDNLLVCSMRVADNPAGIHLLKNIIKNF